MAELGAKSQVWKHEAQLKWMREQFGYNYAKMTPLQIVTAFALHRGPWRRTEEYQKLVLEHREMRAAKAAAYKAAKANGAKTTAKKASAGTAPKRGGAAGRGRRPRRSDPFA